MGDAVQVPEDAADLLARHDDREPLGALRADQVVKPGQLDPENVAI